MNNSPTTPSPPDDDPSESSEPRITNFKDRAKMTRRLSETIGNSRDILLTARTVFPFTLFPDTAVLDREKLTIAHRVFFRVAEVISIRVEDILNVTAEVGPLFGSIKIHTRFFDPDRPYAINYMRRDDAMRFKRVLLGYIVAIQKNVDCSVFEAEQLADLLDELGQGDPKKET